MISVEWREKVSNRGPRISIRIWDGYDKPEYYQVLSISEEEFNNVGGRFKNHKKFLTLDEQRNCSELFLLVNQPAHDLIEISEWIGENINGSWMLDIVEASTPVWKFVFTKPEDAVLFKLVWDARASPYQLDLIED